MPMVERINDPLPRKTWLKRNREMDDPAFTETSDQHRV